jgi:hypothetical protein
MGQHSDFVAKVMATLRHSQDSASDLILELRFALGAYEDDMEGRSRWIVCGRPSAKSFRD